MFKELKNQALLQFNIVTDSPFCIKSGNNNEIDPSLPDMQCLRTQKNGQPTVFIPGSSLKGVIRTRYEKIAKLFGGRVCNVVDKNESCSKTYEKKENESGEKIHQKICEGCKLFGCGLLGSAISFKDAYPVGDVVIGLRNGVGINRITGGAQKGAIYNFEVVEEGTFETTITLINFALYQLKLLAFALKDLNDGYVSIGGSTTRGLGKVKVEDFKIKIKDFRKDSPTRIRGYKSEDTGGNTTYIKELYYHLTEIEGLEQLIDVLDNVEIKFERG